MNKDNLTAYEVVTEEELTANLKSAANYIKESKDLNNQSNTYCPYRYFVIGQQRNKCKNDRGAGFMSRCQYTVGNGWHGKGRLPKESGYSERRVPGLPQNMRQTVTGLWSAIIGRT